MKFYIAHQASLHPEVPASIWEDINDLVSSKQEEDGFWSDAAEEVMHSAVQQAIEQYSNDQVEEVVSEPPESMDSAARSVRRRPCLPPWRR